MRNPYTKLVRKKSQMDPADNQGYKRVKIGKAS
jgi:hypothetical protein